jgi:HNH endonuclease
MTIRKRRPAARDREIPIPYLRECLDADFATGKLKWRARPREHFKTNRAWNTWSARFAGAPALTSRHGGGYLRGTLTFAGRKYKIYVHRVVFALTHDRWPVDEIDHRHGVEAGNGIGNLREATHGENGQNHKKPRTNKSGFIGVHWNVRQRQWIAEIQVQGAHRHLGVFTTIEEAAGAYLAAKAQYHPFQPVPRDAEIVEGRP